MICSHGFWATNPKTLLWDKSLLYTLIGSMGFQTAFVWKMNAARYCFGYLTPRRIHSFIISPFDVPEFIIVLRAISDRLSLYSSPGNIEKISSLSALSTDGLNAVLASCCSGMQSAFHSPIGEDLTPIADNIGPRNKPHANNAATADTARLFPNPFNNNN